MKKDFSLEERIAMQEKLLQSTLERPLQGNVYYEKYLKMVKRNLKKMKKELEERDIHE